MATPVTHQLPPAEARPSRRVPPLRRPASDERLVARLRAGDERAFELLYERHHRGLLAFCRHMLGSREEAEDALQHVFVSAHRHLLADERDVNLRPWLYAIARNRCLSILRARREAAALDDVHEPSTDGLAVAHEVERREELRELLADMARLPEDQRAALVLAEIGALSHEEIAEALDVRRDKVKALIFQARETLAARRSARTADCREIREQLATLRGGALRRTELRRHVEVCPGCRAFQDEVRRQRAAFALVLPVVPTGALKAKVLGGVAGAGAAGAVGSAGVATFAGGIVTKLLAVAAVAGVAGGGYAAVEGVPGGSRPAERPATTEGPVASAASAAPAAAATTITAAPGAAAHRTGTTTTRTAKHGASASTPARPHTGLPAATAAPIAQQRSHGARGQQQRARPQHAAGRTHKPARTKTHVTHKPAQAKAKVKTHVTHKPVKATPVVTAPVTTTPTHTGAKGRPTTTATTTAESTQPPVAPASTEPTPTDPTGTPAP